MAFTFGASAAVHAWACWHVYKITAAAGRQDVRFLERCFHKLLINFSW